VRVKILLICLNNIITTKQFSLTSEIPKLTRHLNYCHHTQASNYEIPKLSGHTIDKSTAHATKASNYHGIQRLQYLHFKLNFLVPSTNNQDI